MPSRAGTPHRLGEDHAQREAREQAADELGGDVHHAARELDPAGDPDAQRHGRVEVRRPRRRRAPRRGRRARGRGRGRCRSDRSALPRSIPASTMIAPAPTKMNRKPPTASAVSGPQSERFMALPLDLPWCLRVNSSERGAASERPTGARWRGRCAGCGMMRGVDRREEPMSTRRSSGWSPSGTEIVGFLLIAVGVDLPPRQREHHQHQLGRAVAAHPRRRRRADPGPRDAPGRAAAARPRGDADRRDGRRCRGAPGTPPPAGPAPAGRGTASLLVPREGATQLDLELASAPARSGVGGGSTELVEVRSSREDIYSRIDRSGARANVRLRQDASWLPWSFRGGTDWGVRLAEDVATVFTLNAGAGDFSIDLSRLRIVDARLSIGAAQARVVLPRPTGEVNVRVTAGASTVTVEIPPGVEARVRSEGGLLRFEGRGETAELLDEPRSGHGLDLGRRVLRPRALIRSCRRRVRPRARAAAARRRRSARR